MIRNLKQHFLRGQRSKCKQAPLLMLSQFIIETTYVKEKEIHICICGHACSHCEHACPQHARMQCNSICSEGSAIACFFIMCIVYSIGINLLRLKHIHCYNLQCIFLAKKNTL